MLAYVHCLILNSPYYSREDKNIKGKIEEYYEDEMEDISVPRDQDYDLGVHAMFKDYYCWMCKDPVAGYKPCMDYFVESPPPAEAPPQSRRRYAGW